MGIFHDGNTCAVISNEDLGITPAQLLDEYYYYDFLVCSNPQTQLFDMIFAEFERVEQMLPAFDSEGVLDKEKYCRLAGAVFNIYTTLMIGSDIKTVRVKADEIRTSDDNFSILLESREFIRDLWLRYYQRLHLNQSS